MDVRDKSNVANPARAKLYADLAKRGLTVQHSPLGDTVFIEGWGNVEPEFGLLLPEKKGESQPVNPTTTAAAALSGGDKTIASTPVQPTAEQLAEKGGWRNGPNGTLLVQPAMVEATAALAMNLLQPDVGPLSQPAQAGGGLLSWVDKQLEEAPADMPPLWDFWTLDEQGAQDLAKSAPRLLEEARAAKKFRGEWEKFSTDAITGEPKQVTTMDELKAFVEERKDAHLTPGQRTLIMKKFMFYAKQDEAIEKKAWTEAGNWYEQSIKVDKRFSTYEIPAEFYLVSLNYQKRFLDTIQNANNYLADRVKTNQKLARQGKNKWETYRAIGINGEVFAAIGKAFKGLWMKAGKGQLTAEELAVITKENGGVPPADPKLAALQLSTKYYEAGFATDFDYYPGINAVYNNLTLGNFDRAERLAPMVWQGCLNEGGKRSNDYWCLVTMLEVSLINRNNREVQDILPKVLNRCRADWEVSTSADNMEMLAAQRKAKGENTDMLDFVAATLRERIKAGFPPPAEFDKNAWIEGARVKAAELVGNLPADVDNSIPQTDITKAVEDKSFHFRGISSKYVEGSVPYGGLLPDISVNRTSIRIARQILNELKLTHTTDFDTFNAKADRYINERFALDDPVSGTRPHENLRSPEHKRRDIFRRNLLYFTHAFESGDGRSNAVAELLLGEGDCRHVAYCAKQLLYDVWKRDNQTRFLQEGFDAVLAMEAKPEDGRVAAYRAQMLHDAQKHDLKQATMQAGFEAQMAGVPNAYETALAKVRELDKEQLVTFSVRLRAPVQMVKYYEWRTDEQGRPLAHPEGQIQDVEDHTFNALTRRPDTVNVEQITSKDSFYKVLYPLGNREFKPEEILDETNGFFAGHLGIPNDKNEAIPFWALPTRFSGRQHKSSEDECGEMLLGGAPLASPDPNFFMQSRDKFQHLVEAVSTMVVGKLKAKVLDAMMTTMLDQSAADAHALWRQARAAEKADSSHPYMGFGKTVAVTEELKSLSFDDMHKTLDASAPGILLSPQKYDAIRNAPVGSTVLDHRDRDYEELMKTQMDGGMRMAGELAVPPLALALYLHDFRHGEDLRLVLKSLMEGSDPQGAAELLKVNRTAFLAAQFMHGERSYQNTIDAMQPTGKTKELDGRGDFKSFHALHEEVAKLDEYALGQAGKWLLKYIDQQKPTSTPELLQTIIGDLVESSAADAHNVGWKVAKDQALADPNNCFLGWAPKRVRSTADLRAMDREHLAAALQIEPERITEEKLQAVKKSADKADLVHNWYKPYNEVLTAEGDGGVRLGGQNALPLLVMGLYLSDFRNAEQMSVGQLRQTVQGLMDGTDKAGIQKAEMLMHVAFQAGQLVHGERAQKNVVAEMQRTDGKVELPENPNFTSITSLPLGLRQANVNQAAPSITWLDGHLGQIAES